MTSPPAPPRLPPGQVLTAKWPVLTYGETPRIDLSTWTLRCFGLVEREVSWTWKEFLELPRVTVKSDVHCVTRWSRYDNEWEGVAAREILSRANVRPGANAVMAHSEGGYTTNLRVSDLLEDDVLLAVKHDGQVLAISFLRRRVSVRSLDLIHVHRLAALGRPASGRCLDDEPAHELHEIRAEEAIVLVEDVW